MNTEKNVADVISKTQYWLESFIIKHQLCPFAKREFDQESIHFAVSLMHDTEALLTSLINELDRLNNNDEIATTLLIHPNALLDFAEYNQFLSITDLLLEEKKIIGVYQIASFHPDYQFAGTSINDAENYTNRSPFPMLHILRESMVEDAIARYQNVDDIPKRNIALMNQIGSSDLLAYFSKIQKKSID